MLLAALGLLVGACTDDAPTPTRASGSATLPALRIAAASSLVDVLPELLRIYAAEHPAAPAVTAFGGSQMLRAQIEQGARVDLFLAASPEPAEALHRAGHSSAPLVFACNEPVLAVALGAEGISSLAELPNASRIALGASESPIGAYTDAVLARATERFGAAWRARVDRQVVSREPNVRQVLAKIELGEVDAGLVYRTDARAAAGRVRVVPLDAGLAVPARYVAVVPTRAEHPERARSFVEALSSEPLARVLADAGFVTCPR